ncbi:MAG TPA: aconitase X catalytic domain-containing protein [Methanoregulaceae archaeon]|nr:MAG: aconitase X catalytic domain-containing protein [Methanolinea sp.]HON80656.1 aconitase X catalytic domain-containing protein [Methanoregulaceae archaeon]HPD09390.1 aconitase X catalytic domain-containing protein [Methanoregulaceae archaeon]HRT14817.1 aconitase X catalytic domain-containing protein [Methanoregulaceae archaeon]HRU30390.1 aconitase X catalytic domain-containing protein [Methanoregulaceae archaeon]
MHLLPEEEQVLAGEYGETRQKMMEILVALGKVFGAARLVPVRSAQVSGASYKTIGDAGIEWLSGLEARVSVPTVLNPVGMDRISWREMGIPPDFARKQEEVIAAYSRLGVRLECTCTPYYIYQTRFGEHLAWSESSAVSFANSVIGARTNREGGPGALAAAIIGKTPEYGLHLVEERRPQVHIRVEGDGPHDDIAFYGALGFLAGKLAGNRIPFFSGIRPRRDQLKALGAAMAASGAVALYHVEGITPEARIFSYDVADLEYLPVTAGEVAALWSGIPVDAVALGCPHCSPEELSVIAGLLAGKRVKIPVYVFSARKVIEASRDAVAVIEQSGARVYADTCMVVSPAMERFGTIMVNSGKAFSYVPDMCRAAVRIGTTAECIAVATGTPGA